MKINAYKIKALIAEMGMTRFEFSEKAGIANTTFCRMLKVGHGTLKNVGKVAAALGVPVSEIAEEG